MPGTRRAFGAMKRQASGGADGTRPGGRSYRWGIWLARCLLALLFVAGAFLSLVPQGRAAARAALLLPAFVTASQPAPLVVSGEPIRHTQTVIDARSGPVYLDIYEPTTPPPPVPGSREGVVIISGVGDNRNVDQLVNLSESLARSGLVAMEMTTNALLGYELNPDDVDAVVQADLALAKWPGVGARRTGILGFSAGGALAFLAAADPRLRDSLAYVTLFGSYFDATTLLRDFGRRALLVDGKLQPWSPQLVPVQVLANTIGTTLPPSEANTLESAFATSIGPLSATDLDSLSPPAAAAYHLLEGDEPERADANIAALSPQMRQLLAALSPSSVVAQVHTPVYLLHDRADEYVPFTQSRDCAAALARLDKQYDFAELGIFAHVEVKSGNGVLPLLHDGTSLFRILSDLLVPAS